MTDPIVTLVTEPQEAQPSISLAPSAGALLRQARERAGLHLGMLSVALKVPVSHLTALESDNHAQLSGPVFVRALAGSVCRQLKIDATPVLALLPQAPQHMKVMPPSLEKTRPDLTGQHFGRRWTVNRKFVLLALLMAVLIALVAWMPEWPAADSLSALPVAETTPPISEPLAPQAPMVVLLPSESAADAAPGSALPGLKTANSIGAALPVPAENSALEVVFKGRSDEAWVEVQDRNGVVVFSRLVKAGETHIVKGMPTLTVVVGMADAVDVLVRGQPLDLTPFSRGAVARFEVK
jgi:cytoskeleton protein RodZ